MVKNNVKFIDKKSVFIDKNVKLGKNVVIHPNNYIIGDSVIEDGVILLPNNTIKDSVISLNSKVESSHIEESVVGENCVVGPFARLRPKTKIGKNCKIGNFVEIKNSVVKNGSKISHLAYVGDCEIGENCNVGCGVIFVNYNGKEKNKSVVGNNCFIGSNVNVVAPVNIADNSYICAGTTLTIDTNENDFVIGRVRETIKHNYSLKYRKQEK